MTDLSRRRALGLLTAAPLAVELAPVLRRPRATIQTQKVRDWPYRLTDAETEIAEWTSESTLVTTRFLHATHEHGRNYAITRQELVLADDLYRTVNEQFEAGSQLAPLNHHKEADPK